MRKMPESKTLTSAKVPSHRYEGVPWSIGTHVYPDVICEPIAWPSDEIEGDPPPGHTVTEQLLAVPGIGSLTVVGLTAPSGAVLATVDYPILESSVEAEIMRAVAAALVTLRREVRGADRTADMCRLVLHDTLRCVLAQWYVEAAPSLDAPTRLHLSTICERLVYAGGHPLPVGTLDGCQDLRAVSPIPRLVAV